MNPTFLDNMSWEMAEVYGAITDQILINLARYFPYISAGNVPRSAFTYQAAMLAQMGQVNKDTIRIIKNNLKGAGRALSKVLEQSIIDAVSKTEPQLLKAVKAGILKPAGIPIVAPNQMRAFNLYYQQAAQKLNLVNTVMLESTKSAYQKTVSDVVNRIQATQTALDIGAGETITGVSSWNQALRHSINRLKQDGITGFIDHGNHHWSAEAYVAMDIRTTVYNTGRAAVWETNQNFGNDLYIVSYHDGARPLCYPWQNKVISSTNHARTTYDLDGNEIQVYAQSDTSYGQPAGLFGINCKHYPSPFIPGVSVLYDKDNIPSEKENKKVYEQTQQQRALERKLREEKRDLLMAKAQGADTEEIKALRARCRETSDDIDKFCEETGLPRRQNREGVFTQRDFPAADTYDPKDFERKQKDEIDEYFKKGGAQQGYTFGEMTPKTPIVPNPSPVAPTPAPTPAPQNVAPKATPESTPVVQSPVTEKSELMKRLETSNVEARPVERFTTQPTEQEIIDRIGGADQTKGSCASLAWTYAGNRNGLDVLDFRDGTSRTFFSTRSNSAMVAKLDGVVGKIVESNNDFKAVHELMKEMSEGKEYYLATGRHAAIIKKVGTGYQYLELQSGSTLDAYKNGWHELNDTALRYRFACKKSHSTYGFKFEIPNILVDIGSLNGNKDFETMLEYINTAAEMQRKGVGGGIK